jgi:G3E family GTPase
LRTAVIVNELGDVGIDGELIVSRDDDMVELDNGCICCSLNNDFLDTIFRILDRAPRRLPGGRNDRRCRPTAGGAHVSALGIARSDAARFDRHGRGRRKLLPRAFRQQGGAQPALPRRRHSAQQVRSRGGRAVAGVGGGNPHAGARSAHPAHDPVRGCAPAHPQRRLFQSDRFFGDRAEDESACEHAHNHEQGGNGHLAADGFESLSFRSERPFAVHKFQSFLERLPDNVYRAKGLVWIKESEKRYVFHLVAKRFSLDERDGGTADNKLVLIGRNLDRAQLRSGLEACLAP